MQEEESFIEAYLMELEAEKEVELEEEPEVFFDEIADSSENSEDAEASERSPDFEEKPESEDTILLPAKGTCRRKPLTNYYREEKGVQRNSWRKEKRKWRPS